MTHVTFLALPGSLGTSITIPLEMLNAAREISLTRKYPETRSRKLTLAIAGMDKSDVILAGGLKITPQLSISEITATDLIFVPGLWRSPDRTIKKFSRLSAWLAERHAGGSTLCSIGTGSYFLAYAGLLDQLPATTHWYYFDDFQKNFPLVKLQRNRFITLANRLYCTGSVNAARDVILHLVEHLFDDVIASEVSRHFTHELKRSYESLLLEEQQQDTHHDELIIQVQEWLQVNYQNEIQLQDVADRFKLSVRSLNRRFRQAANNAPLQYLQEIRVEHAKELLKKSNLGIAEICYRIGYLDNSYFSSLFKKMNGVTPTQYRSLVRSKLFSVDESRQT